MGKRPIAAMKEVVDHVQGRTALSMRNDGNPTLLAQRLLPGRSAFPVEPFVRFGVADESFLRRVPLQRAAIPGGHFVS